TLPLNQRNPFALLLLVPGASGTVGSDIYGGNFSINGGRTGTNEILLDGVTSTPPSDNSNRLTILPSVDAVQEFRVQTNNFSAEFGNSGGGIINLIYKSGTNQLHGSMFEFLRNSVMDSNSFYSNLHGTPLGSFKRNQFGASAGGPVELPKVYRGRNRTFFFVDYEGLRQRSASSTTLTVPTLAQRSGDFSQTLNAKGQVIAIYDPTSSLHSASGYTRTPVPGNKIPAALMDPVSRKVAQLYPLANVPGDAYTGANNFYASAAGPGINDQYDIKVDHNLSDRQRVSFRWSKRYLYSEPAHFFPSDLLPGQSGGTQDYRNTGAVANYDLTVGPTFFTNLRYGLARTFRFSGVMGLGFDATSLGLPSYVAANADLAVMPAFAPESYTTLGNGNAVGLGPTALESHVLQLANTKVFTRHTLKFGAEVRVYRNNTSQSGDNGSFKFTRNMSAGPDPSSSASSVTGDGFASLLFGYGSGDLIKNYKSVSTQSEYYALYIADDWKVTPTLTLNLGFRYDLTIPRHERYNRAVNLDPAVTSAIAAAAGMPNLKGGLRYLGVDGWPTNQFETQWKNVAPRFGLAWQPGARWVIRGAYGIFWAPPQSAAAQTVSQPGYTATTNYYGTLDGYTPNLPVSNPFPNGFIPVTGNAQGLMTLLGQGLNAPTRNTRNPYIQNWNFGVQRQFMGVVVEASYVGNHGVALADNAGANLDQVPSQYLSLGSALNQQVPNPFYGLISSGTLSAKTVAQKYLLRPYPEFDGFRDINPSIGNSIYHSFQLKAQKRFSSGLSFLLAYTNAKLIDNTSQSGTNFAGSSTAQNSYDFRSERSLSVYDVPQRLVLSFIAELPFGKRKAIGAHWNRAMDALLGGWQFNGIATLQRGLPLLLTATNNVNLFNDGERPNNSGASAALTGPVESRLNRYFDTSVFSQPASFTFGTTSRTLPDVRAPGIRSFDLSLFKNYKLMERLTAQFRAEAFNALNTPQFSGPTVSLSSVSFGAISSTANTPRQMQLGVKLLF
ncbi:MAG TPA: TonB-dependent receptor, partial [Candidatus Solibacter sp.]